MKKRSLYKKNAFSFHKYVVSQKRNASTNIVEKIGCKLRRRFGYYKRLLREDRLEELRNLQLCQERKGALQDLYSYKAKAFTQLRLDLTTDENGRISNLCPYCQLEIAGTLDHIIPQTPFPEYSTHPYNLIPCCSTCNGKKNDDWVRAGQRIIIDFYIDDIPAIQYLNAAPRVIDEHLDVTYSLSFPMGYDPILKGRLETHYSRLNLLNRYRSNTDDEILKLQTEIKSSVEYGISDDIIKQIILRKSHDYQEKHGTNYWVAILMQACVNDTVVYNYIKSH